MPVRLHLLKVVISESNTRPEALLEEPSPVNTEVSTPEYSHPWLPFADTGDFCVGTSCLPNSSTCISSLNEVDKILVRALDSNEDCGRSDSADMLPCAHENVTVNIVDHNISMNSNSEESNEVFKSSFGCNLEENSNPNFLKELGADDAPYFVESFELNSPNAEVSAQPVGSPAADLERHLYNPYSWTPMEIEVTSGNAGCTLVEHSLKLRSAYADVEDHSGTKDSCREPEVTSYDRLFMGTIDCIWYSEGLQTVKVLHTSYNSQTCLKGTPGFPTHRWESDHLALACQLAFTEGVPTKK